MLATFFIANGVKAVKDPEPFVDAADPLAQKFVPFAQRTFPEAVSAYVPEDTRSLVRLNGAAGIAGGLGMATGIAPRGGAVLAAASMVPHVLASDPRGAVNKSEARSIFVRNLALAGAALVLSQDTHGKPSLFWRANDSANRLGRTTTKAVEGVQADGAKLSRRTQKKLDRAARDVGKKLGLVSTDYDKLSETAKRRLDRATREAAKRLEAATQNVKDALQ